MNQRQESRKHHYVPAFLMKPWTIDRVLNGYWWDTWNQRLRCKKRGTDGFCYEPYLVSLERHPEAGRIFVLTEAPGFQGGSSLGWTSCLSCGTSLLHRGCIGAGTGWSFRR